MITAFDRLKESSVRRRAALALAPLVLWVVVRFPVPWFGSLAAPVAVAAGVFFGTRRSLLMVLAVLCVDQIEQVARFGSALGAPTMLWALLGPAIVAGIAADRGWTRRTGSAVAAAFACVAVRWAWPTYNFIFSLYAPAYRWQFAGGLALDTVITTGAVLLAGPLLWKRLRPEVSPRTEELLHAVEASATRDAFRSSCLGATLVTIGLLASIGTLAVTIAGRVGALAWYVLLGVDIALIALVSYLLPLGLRLLAPTLRSSLLDDPRRPVLYLRAFSADAVGGREASEFEDSGGRMVIPQRTEEEILVASLRHAGPVIAIGRPGERLPRRGAVRVYVPDERWQAIVELLMREAALVVLWPASSAGVTWEMERARALVQPTRLVLLVPADPETWTTVVEHGRSGLGIELPAHAGRSGKDASFAGLVSFADDWTASRVDFPAHGPLRSALRESLRDVVARLQTGSEPSRHRGSWLAVAALFVVYVILGMA